MSKVRWCSSRRCTTSSRSATRYLGDELGAWYVEHNPRTADSLTVRLAARALAHVRLRQALLTPSAASAVQVRDASAFATLLECAPCASLSHLVSPLGGVRVCRRAGARASSSADVAERRRRQPDQPEQPADPARRRGQRRGADVAARQRRARTASRHAKPGRAWRASSRWRARSTSRSAPTSATGRCRDEVKFANQANQPGNNPACVATVGTAPSGTPVGHSYHGWGKAVDLTDAGRSLTFASPGYAFMKQVAGLARLEPSRVRGARRQHVSRAVALGVGRRRRQPRRVAPCAATRSRCCRAPTTAATRRSTVSAGSRAHGNFVNRGSAGVDPDRVGDGRRAPTRSTAAV